MQGLSAEFAARANHGEGIALLEPDLVTLLIGINDKWDEVLIPALSLKHARTHTHSHTHTPHTLPFSCGFLLPACHLPLTSVLGSW